MFRRPRISQEAIRELKEYVSNWMHHSPLDIGTKITTLSKIQSYFDGYSTGDNYVAFRNLGLSASLLKRLAPKNELGVLRLTKSEEMVEYIRNELLASHKLSNLQTNQDPISLITQTDLFKTLSQSSSLEIRNIINEINIRFLLNQVNIFAAQVPDISERNVWFPHHRTNLRSYGRYFDKNSTPFLNCSVLLYTLDSDPDNFYALVRSSLSYRTNQNTTPTAFAKGATKVIKLYAFVFQFISTQPTRGVRVIVPRSESFFKAVAISSTVSTQKGFAPTIKKEERFKQKHDAMRNLYQRDKDFAEYVNLIFTDSQNNTRAVSWQRSKGIALVSRGQLAPELRGKEWSHSQKVWAIYSLLYDIGRIVREEKVWPHDIKLDNTTLTTVNDKYELSLIDYRAMNITFIYQKILSNEIFQFGRMIINGDYINNDRNSKALYDKLCRLLCFEIILLIFSIINIKKFTSPLFDHRFYFKRDYFETQVQISNAIQGMPFSETFLRYYSIFSINS